MVMTTIYCMSEVRRIWRQLWKLNGRSIRMRFMLLSRPRTEVKKWEPSQLEANIQATGLLRLIGTRTSLRG